QECLEVFQWTNGLARGQALTPLETELYRAASTDPDLARAMLDVFSRSRLPSSVVGPVRAIRILARAIAHPDGSRRDVVTTAAADVRTAVRDARVRRRVMSVPTTPARR
ncbi:MAG: oxidoreductase, partial [Solirubrobacteraceae bacterium]